jgi:hypothetical protein
MLIMLKEIVGDDVRDRTINPDRVRDISSASKDEVQNSVIEMDDGTKIYVQGNVFELTKRLNGEKRLLRG